MKTTIAKANRVDGEAEWLSGIGNARNKREGKISMLNSKEFFLMLCPSVLTS